MSELRSKMIRAMELRDFAPKTQKSYLSTVQGLAVFHNKPPDRLTQEEVDDYLLHLKETGKTSSTRSVAISALRFFYDHVQQDKAIVKSLIVFGHFKLSDQLVFRANPVRNRQR